MPYKNEIVFKKHHIEQLRECGYFITPVQTRTIVGVPDVYAAHTAHCLWIEYKHIDSTFSTDAVAYRIPFRPGQQRWAAELRNATRGGCEVLCAVAFRNGVYGFWMDEPYNSGLVPPKCIKPLVLNRGHIDLLRSES